MIWSSDSYDPMSTMYYDRSAEEAPTAGAELRRQNKTNMEDISR